MSYSLLIFVGIILFLVLIFGVVISSFFLTKEEEPRQISRTQREHHTKTLKDVIERSAVQEKLNRKVSTSEEIFNPSEEEFHNVIQHVNQQIEISQQEITSSQLETNKPEATSSSEGKDYKPEATSSSEGKDYKEGDPIHILENEAEKIELKRRIRPSQQPPSQQPPSQQPPSQQPPSQQPPSSKPPTKKIKSSEKSDDEGDIKDKMVTRGVLPKQLLSGYKKEQKYKKQQEKRMVMKQDLQDRSSIYKDPTEGICVHTRAECPDYTSDCFLGAGHLDLKECVEKAERIQENINRHNERFGSADTRRKSGVKYISWAPGGVYPDTQNPQCMILSDSAKVVVDQKGWKTYVKNPTSFTMTQNPSVYLVEGKCPTIKE